MRSFSPLIFAIAAASLGTIASAQAEDEPTGATYVVPTSDGSLWPSAVYSWKDQAWATPTSIAFWLPPDLTGNEFAPPFYMTRDPGGRWTGGGMAGALVGDCRYVEPDFSCDIAFPRIDVDLARVESIWRAKTSDEKQIRARVAVSRIFSGELHGVVIVRISPKRRAEFRAGR